MAVLLMAVSVFIVAIVRQIDIFAAFSDGVKSGLKTVLGILPSVILTITAISVFRASGLLDLLVYTLRPVAEFIGIPSETVPLAVLRPFSGSGSLAMLEDLISNYGVDSRQATVGAVLCASTETTFYTLGVYLSGFSDKCGKILFCALLVDATVVITTGLLV